MTALMLPTTGGRLESYTLTGTPVETSPVSPARSRVAYAATHVVADPLADNSPGQPARLDWDATLAFRHHLWRCGIGVADAMDTAQRGMGMNWPATAQLIRRCAAEASAVGGALLCGVGTDQLPDGVHGIDDVVRAYTEQLEVVEDSGASAVLMASRQLAAIASGPGDYAHVYGTLLRQVSRPVVLHWLGPMFDPALTGYWGSTDLDAATDTLLEIVTEHADRVDGVKLSLLDEQREVAFRRRLPAGVRCYTGDDFHYPELIVGDTEGYSDALLGVFDPIAPVASTALAKLDAGDVAGYEAAFAPTVPLARQVFHEPTYYYKTGVVFLAWLAGHQRHFTMVAGLQSARSLPHLAELFVLADRAGLFPDPELAGGRMRTLLHLAGVDA
ncbi:MAG: dihydrodipicolinate synthase family protein [Streptosporangiales bacterium]